MTIYAVTALIPINGGIQCLVISAHTNLEAAEESANRWVNCSEYSNMRSVRYYSATDSNHSELKRLQAEGVTLVEITYPL